MPPHAAIRLSVIVVTYNSSVATAAALPALIAQLRDGDELIVVDNASADDTVAAIRRVAPEATIIRNAMNEGFAAGANHGARVASGDLLVFLNPDATPADGFAEAIRRPLAGDRGWSAWMGLVTSDHGRLVNTNGGIVHFTAISWAGETGALAPGSVDGPCEVAFASGACLAVPSYEWQRVGGFAERYFMYHEDVDLSLRVRLAGGRVGIEPTAVVDHDYEFDKGTAKWRYLERNRWATIVRCYPSGLLALVAPGLVATELALAVVAAAGGWAPEKAQATRETLRDLRSLLRERRAIQRARVISSADFASWLTADLRSPFLGRAGRSRLLAAALRSYWRLVTQTLEVGCSSAR
jgi:N-acetylglucosaminyl-diphospho-decaprenol L-rhamnosyltransferase